MCALLQLCDEVNCNKPNTTVFTEQKIVFTRQHILHHCIVALCAAFRLSLLLITQRYATDTYTHTHS